MKVTCESVYRDVRFSSDKTPYKTNIGIQFRHAAGKDVHAPGFYLHIDTKEVFLAAGIWRPDNPTLAQMRMHMDDNQGPWKKMTKALGTKGFAFGGESLKRPPRGFDAEHPLVEDLKRKDFIVAQNLKAATISEKDFVAQTAKLFTGSKPLVRFICEACDLDF